MHTTLAYYSLTSGSVRTNFLKASATGTTNAQQCQRVESRARSAHSARVIDESDDQKNHSSPDPDAAAAAAAPLAGKLDQRLWYARNPPVRVRHGATRSENARFHPERRFSPADFLSAD